ncbi:LamG-like jellyroll fold domain-containing protein [Paraglaciecola sp. L3A3]|uniref:LamG-like jellyroll fold domain-containing protein n=1 Tax=Paraglaciecola sp. L3A3 TaxID=2686358 RepID=UPI00131B41E7|nr:LamG-like jellyroll fold domain-containing protein [Paraglaciecola sp. L3A3]
MNKQHQALIAAYLAGEKLENELIEACKTSPQLRQQLAEDVAFERILKHVLLAKSDEQFIDDFESNFMTNKPVTAKVVYSSFNRKFFSLCASFAAMCLIFIFYLNSTENLGIIVNTAGASYQQNELNDGEFINKGRFSLSKGYAELELKNGVILVLEAPLELNINTVDQVELLEGRLVAKVPQQAIGFEVLTPSSEIVDLGTEFGVAVDKSGDSQVHVLEGEIKVRANKSLSYEHLIENQGRIFSGDQQVRIIKSQPHLFMRVLPGHSIDNPAYLHWSFDNKQGNKFVCQGPGIQGRCYYAEYKTLDKRDINQRLIEGKYGQGMSFDGINNWLETEFKGIEGNKPRTVAMWVKVPKTFSVNNGYGIVSWGLPEVLSAWQISPNPSEELGPLGRIRIGTNHGEIIGTTDLRDDEWHHIAVVLFGGEHANLATHVLIYVDGVLEKTSRKSIAKVFTELKHQESQPLRMGRNIAYKNLNNSEQKHRFFKGAVDEVYIFDSALQRQQVLKLMTSNKFN